VYDSDQIILRLDAAGNVQSRYLWGVGTDQLLAEERLENAVDNVFWMLGDHQNSVREAE
jgi:hypothetical protein